MDTIKLLYDMFIQFREKIYQAYDFKDENSIIKLKLLLLSSDHLSIFLDYINNKISLKEYANNVLIISDKVGKFSKVNHNYMLEYKIIKDTVNSI